MSCLVLVFGLLVTVDDDRTVLHIVIAHEVAGDIGIRNFRIEFAQVVIETG